MLTLNNTLYFYLIYYNFGIYMPRFQIYMQDFCVYVNSPQVVALWGGNILSEMCCFFWNEIHVYSMTLKDWGWGKSMSLSLSTSYLSESESTTKAVIWGWMTGTGKSRFLKSCWNSPSSSLLTDSPSVLRSGKSKISLSLLKPGILLTRCVKRKWNIT